MVKKKIFIIGLILLVGVIVFGFFFFPEQGNWQTDYSNFDAPERILSYGRVELKDISNECVHITEDEIIKNLCSTTKRAIYQDGEDQVQVMINIIQGDRKKFLKHYREAYDSGVLVPNVYISPGREADRLHWYPDEYDIVTVQQYISEDGALQDASLKNPVIDYYLKKYPPMKW